MISNLSQVTPTTASKVHEPASGTVSPAIGSSNQVSAVAVNTDTAVTTNGVPGGQNAGATDQTLVEAIDKLNAKVQNLNRNLEFSLDKGSGEVLVKVIDAQTHELVRQIPSEEALALAQNIDQYMLDHHMGLVQTKA